MEYLNKIILGNCLTGIKQMPDNSVDCCITSPPYWGLRDYGVDQQLGQENDFRNFVNNLLDIFLEIKRVLKPTGTCWVNLGDTYNGNKIENTKNNKNPNLVNSNFKKEKYQTIKEKSLLMIPERFAIEMIDAGWILRNQIIWHKPNQMPQSAKDRFTVDFEKIFFFVKQPIEYYFEQQLEKAIGYDGRNDIDYKGGKKDVSIGKHTRWKFHKNIQEKGQQPNSMHIKRAIGELDKVYPMRNMRAVWSINTEPFPEAHFATYPEKLVERMIKAGCPENGLVLDPFMGAGTTAVVAKKLNRNYTGFELNPEYKLIAENRLIKEVGLF